MAFLFAVIDKRGRKIFDKFSLRLYFYFQFQIYPKAQKIKSVNPEINLSVRTEGETAIVFAGDYLNKLSGEKIERECRRKLEAGYKTLIVNFSETEIVNSIGVSILLGVIDAANDANAKVVFSDINDNTIELFEMLGLTNHVKIEG